jgi:bifunctional UDP-N-acetylglucosamine pyrophosphorylase / glucosamine-1-phosphate N-acetyltransferase
MTKNLTDSDEQQLPPSDVREVAQTSGATIMDLKSTYIDPGIEVGPGTVIYPNTTLIGQTTIGARCRIGPNSVISDSRIEDEVTVVASFVEGAVIEQGADVGPFSHLRPGAHLEPGVHIGNFVEVKASRIGARTRAGHFSYIGDARIGADVNIGAGTVTCNYDGENKNETVIEDGAFIGSDTMLVAPIRIGRKAATGAGSVVTKDVPNGARVAGVPARRTTTTDARKLRTSLSSGSKNTRSDHTKPRSNRNRPAKQGRKKRG